MPEENLRMESANKIHTQLPASCIDERKEPTSPLEWCAVLIQNGLGTKNPLALPGVEPETKCTASENSTSVPNYSCENKNFILIVCRLSGF